MKTLITLLLICLSTYCNAQIETDLPHVHIVRNTVTNVCQMRVYYRGKHYVNIQKGLKKQFEQDVRVNFNTPITFVWVEGCYVTIKSKKHQTVKIKVL